MKAYINPVSVTDTQGRTFDKFQVKAGQTVIGEYLTLHTARSVRDAVNNSQPQPHVAMVLTEYGK